MSSDIEKVLYTYCVMSLKTHMPKINEGKTDRAIRTIIGLILSGISLFALTGIARFLTGMVGLAALFTGATGYCHLYKILKISTIEKKLA